MAGETLLVLTGMGVPPYSARGLTQSLTPIAASMSLRRTVNGELVNLGQDQFQKYASTITCDDQEVPALEGIWPGQQMTVECVAELAFETSTGSSPSRPYDTGSIREEDDGFTYYRPTLIMMVVSFSEVRDEYGHQTTWQLDLEEV